jgi:hypothetical protein
MKGKSLLLASVMALMAPVAQADTVYFSESTLVFQCRDEQTFRNLLKGVNPDYMKAELKERVSVVRGEILHNGNPKCDFLLTTEGKYGFFQQLTEVTPVALITSDIGNGVTLSSGFYVAYDITGDPMYMFLVFPIKNSVIQPGFDLVVRTLGSS